MAEEKKGRGGKREGSGRKATGRLKQYSTISIAGAPEEIESIRLAAKKAGKTVSRYIIESLVKPE